ncbi:GNAT family N-acetyltransferase, partial [Nocardia sp. NPDC058497]|uniref:GNAT family N-acetyltransferase n=1 Tax=Nocardia sp. NPDC058497 TaxID=3346529 RepID=UPI003657FC76
PMTAKVRGSASEGAHWTVEPAEPHSPEAAAVLRLYLAEMISRYYDRPADDAEIDGHLADGYDSDDLSPPTGLLLLARRRGEAVGCIGLRRLDAQMLELTRMFVRPDVRGEGGAALLLGKVESAAGELGARTIRLNTRNDLVEARALYTKHGYAEIPPYGNDPLADHWFEKQLG